MTQTVLLTGITGFIAKRIAYDLLEQGYHVRGSLRSAKRQDEVRAALKGTKVENLSFVPLDLTKDDGWDAAMVGVDVMIHTASPFPMTPPKDENQLIRPAVDGTLRALRAAHGAGVTRVVLTSSMVAIMHTDRPKGHKYGPDDWTDLDHPTTGVYAKSKTMAERAAWDFAAAHPDLELTTIHPGLVCGAPMDRHFGTSLQLIERLMSAKDPMQPNIGLPVVDVIDVSALHIAAMENSTTIGTRVIASDDYLMMPDIAAHLADVFPNQGIKTRIAPKFLLRILALFDPALRQIVPQVGIQIDIDNQNGKDLIGGFVPAKQSIQTAAEFVK
ncbi:MAG: NAD-dependent epimerase/dehydratase family protein [Pseudomonadota bacterium]